MIRVLPADAWHAALWPVVAPLLAPALSRSPDRPDLPAALRAHTAQLWVVLDDVPPASLLAALVTRVSDHPDGARRCLLWLAGGRAVRRWAAAAVATIGAWARAEGCAELWGAGRPGWRRYAPALGFVPGPALDGHFTWTRRLA